MAIGKGFGKIIFFGEHFVVYNKKAIVAGLEKGISVEIIKNNDGKIILEPVEYRDSREKIIKKVMDYFGVKEGVTLKKVVSEIPAGSGLGSSAAFSVAVARALNKEFKLEKTDKEICNAAYHGEIISHGTPSGVDNTASTFGGLIVFQKKEKGNLIKKLPLGTPLYIVIGNSGKKGNTKEIVSEIKKLKEKNPKIFENIFNAYSSIFENAETALKNGNIKRVGELMNINHGLLSSIGVSSIELEEIVYKSRANGALGSKLVGAGKGGCAIALVESENKAKELSKKIKELGYDSFYSVIK